jgi:hypothetical protein
MTSGKGIMWNLVQFGLQATNPSLDSWSEPFDLFQQDALGEKNVLERGPDGSEKFTQSINVTNTSLLPNFFGKDDGNGGIKSLLGNTNIHFLFFRIY